MEYLILLLVKFSIFKWALGLQGSDGLKMDKNWGRVRVEFLIFGCLEKMYWAR